MNSEKIPSDIDALAEQIARLVLDKLVQRIGSGNLTCNPEQLLCDTEAAKLLGLKPSTLASWRCRGGGPPFFRIGSGRKPAIRYRVGDLKAWACERRYANTAHRIGPDAC